MRRLFYRVYNSENEGLWYDKNGNHTGLIHDKYNFCTNTNLKMPFDPELVGFLSVADSIEELFKWFSKEDILRLQDQGYSVVEVKASNYKFYDPFKHNVVCKNTSSIIKTIKF